jgi:hypothetical protein
MARAGALKRKTELNRGGPLRRTGFRRAQNPTATTSAPARTTLIRSVSAKRAKQNRERRAMISRLWPERPQCGRPGCTRMADDVHEPLTRARGGSITDSANAVPLCRLCHDEVTFAPESQLGWAYEAGLLIHSWERS